MAALNNAKHEAFARAIVAGKSGQAAYRAAGYGAKAAAAETNASRLLRNAQVSARVAELKEAAADAAVMDLNEVLAEQSKIGRANVRDFNRLLAGVDPLAALAAMAPELTAAIQELTLESVPVGRGSKRRLATRIKKFKLHSKAAALAELRAHHEPQRHEHTGKGGGPIETKELAEHSVLETARRIAFALERGRRLLEKKGTKA